MCGTLSVYSLQAISIVGLRWACHYATFNWRLNVSTINVFLIFLSVWVCGGVVSHCWDLTCICKVLWTARVRDWQNPLPHSWHLKGFSLEWMYLWRRRERTWSDICSFNVQPLTCCRTLSAQGRNQYISKLRTIWRVKCSGALVERTRGTGLCQAQVIL